MPDWQPSCSIETLHERAAMLDAVRRFFAARDVLEVQTPVLGQCTVTEPAIDSLQTTDGRYLQTSPEYHMKRLLAAGAPSIYQIGPVFRRGEAGRWHNPEFTMIEWYRLGFDAKQLIDEVAALVDALLGEARYERRTYADLLRERFGADCETEAGVMAAAAALGIDGDVDVADAMDLLLAEALANADGRVFVTGFPAAQAALARLDADGTAARFELTVQGIEVANGYHELADADELAQRMAADARNRQRRGLPAVAPDAKLLAAQTHGLPDCAGVAVGFDRLLALKLRSNALADTIAFDWPRA